MHESKSSRPIMTGVQIRGVPVGSVIRVQPSLERVDVFCDIKEQATAIPRNSKILANQSGLIAEPLIDITPQTPIPQYEVRAKINMCVSAGLECQLISLP